MTLEEARADIDAVDTQMKPLFLKRMECAKKVAEVKAGTGGDVFVLERELSIIEKRAGDVDKEVYDEYVTFLRHLMSVSRRYQYGKLTAMQDAVVDGAAAAAGGIRYPRGPRHDGPVAGQQGQRRQKRPVQGRARGQPPPQPPYIRSHTQSPRV